MADILIVLSVICALASIYLLLQNYHNLWTTESGEVLIAGFQWGRLWGVYTDPNYGGVFSVAAILLCVYFILIRKGLCRIWYVLAICADYIYMIFSDSRTAEVTMCAGAGVILLLLLYSRRKNWKGIAVGFLPSPSSQSEAGNIEHRPELIAQSFTSELLPPYFMTYA